MAATVLNWPISPEKAQLELTQIKSKISI